MCTGRLHGFLSVGVASRKSRYGTRHCPQRHVTRHLDVWEAMHESNKPVDATGSSRIRPIVRQRMVSFLVQVALVPACETWIRRILPRVLVLLLPLLSTTVADTAVYSSVCTLFRVLHRIDPAFTSMVLTSVVSDSNTEDMRLLLTTHPLVKQTWISLFVAPDRSHCRAIACLPREKSTHVGTESKQELRTLISATDTAWRLLRSDKGLVKRLSDWWEETVRVRSDDPWLSNKQWRDALHRYAM